MQRVTLVRYTAKAEHAAENEALSRAGFAELRKTEPDRVAYALLRNGAEFAHVFVNLETDDAAPVVELPTFKAFSKDSAARMVAPPEITRIDFNLVDSYGFARAKVPV